MENSNTTPVENAAPTAPIETISMRDPRTNKFVEVPISAFENAEESAVPTSTSTTSTAPSILAIEAMQQSAPASARHHPPFRNHRDGASGWAVVGDGTYWYRPHSDELQEWMAQKRAEIAGKLGINVEEFEESRYLVDTASNRAQVKQIPASQRPGLANAKEFEKLPAYIEEILDRQMEECIVDWSWDLDEFPLTPSNKRSLFLEVKNELAENINRSTRTGVSQARFLQQSFRSLLS